MNLFEAVHVDTAEKYQYRVKIDLGPVFSFQFQHIAKQTDTIAIL